MRINFNYDIYTNVLYDCYALHWYGSKLGILLTTDIFVELPDDGPVTAETCISHWNKPIVKSCLGLFNKILLCRHPNLFPLIKMIM
jgi:hypothetical protein